MIITASHGLGTGDRPAAASRAATRVIHSVALIVFFSKSAPQHSNFDHNKA
jgi:hypothetical protein